MPITTFQKIQRFCPKAITNYIPATRSVKVAKSGSVTTYGTFRAFFKIAGEPFT